MEAAPEVGVFDEVAVAEGPSLQLLGSGYSGVGDQSTENARSPTVDDEEDEEAECRVCRGEAEPDRRLFAPCKCSGSIRFTHADCLEQWLEHSGKSYCELCSYKFEFKPLYDADAPDVLPWSELLTTVLRIVCFKWLPFAIRAFLVIVLWLGVAPWCTSWLYRMWLLRASAMVNVNFSERFDPVHATSDIFSGIILIVCIVFSFLALMSFADFLRFNLDHIDEAAEEEFHVQQPFRRNNADQAGNDEGAHRHHDQDPQLEMPFARMNGPRRLGNLAAADSDDSSDDEEWVNNAHQDNPFRDAFIQHPQEVGMENVGRDADGFPPRGNELRQRRRQDLLIAPADGQNNNNVNRPAPEAPAGPPRNQRNRAPPANNEWDDDFEHMEINIAVDELLGLRGDVVVLFRNVSWLLAFNGAYLGLFAFIPYTLGSTLLSAGGKILTAIPFDALPFAGAFAVESSEDMHLGVFVIKMLQQAIEEAKKNGDCLQLVDLCTCLAGYFSICFTIILWRFMVTTASSYIHRPLMGGLLWALRCLTAIVKVTSLLLLKMVILPIILGVGIDFATLHLFKVTAQERIAFCMQNMVGSLMVHWVLGITFMLFVTVSVLQLREVVHPDILAKVIRPQEDHPDLLRTLLSEKCVKHARRMILSLAIYAALLVVLIHVPVRIASVVAPSLFPLSLRFQHYCAEIQVPLELLAVHLVVLGVLEHAKNEIGKFQHIGVAFACKYLGLSEYLLPRVDLNARSRNGERKPAIHVLPPPPLHFHPRAQMPPAQLRIEGHRYLPWPEEGLEDPQPMEYDLLPRSTPPHVHARLAGLLMFCWLVCVAVIGAFVFGTLFVGQVCMGPFERLTGISHDPLVMAAGVQIVWYIANGISALSTLMMPEDHVEPSLLERGYCVKSLSPVNAVTSVVGWAFVCPFLVGYIMSACFPTAKSTWMEIFWMGYLSFNLFAWLVCCFRTKTNNRRRRNRIRGVNGEEQDDAFADQMDNDDEDMDDDGEGDEFDDHQHPPLANNAHNVDAEDFFSCLRKSYRQVVFNVGVHEDDDVRMRRDNIQDRCFDAEFFLVKVLKPIITFLALMIVAPTLLSAIILVLVSSGSSTLGKSSFALSCLSIGSVFGAENEASCHAVQATAPAMPPFLQSDAENRRQLRWLRFSSLHNRSGPPRGMDQNDVRVLWDFPEHGRACALNPFLSRHKHAKKQHRTTATTMRRLLESSSAFKLPNGFHTERVQWLYEGSAISASKHAASPPPEAAKQHLLYWMQTSVRSKYNYSLEYALALPLHVMYFLLDRSVVPKASRSKDPNAFGFATERHVKFGLEGLHAVQQKLHKRGLRFEAFRHSHAALTSAAKKQKDTEPTRFQRAQMGLVQVEGDVVVPCETVSKKEEYAARTIRPKITSQLARFIAPLDHQEVSVAARTARSSLLSKLKYLEQSDLGDHEEQQEATTLTPLDVSDMDATLALLDVDWSVRGTSTFIGGEDLAKGFLENKLVRYADDRNEPSGDAGSNLSLYLRYGHICPVRIAVAAKKLANAKSKAGKESFLEELIVRRELAVNMIVYNAHYDSFACLPKYVTISLQLHANDKREHLYTLQELEAGSTYDAYWNTAQMEVVTTGKMHGYMRMYWGKKILEWTPSPEEGFRIALWLNNKYSLDAPDPNSYTGIAWTFGYVLASIIRFYDLLGLMNIFVARCRKHDQGWKERPIFGKVRYMNESGLKRKFRMDAYLRKVKTLVQAYGLPSSEAMASSSTDEAVETKNPSAATKKRKTIDSFYGKQKKAK